MRDPLSGLLLGLDTTLDALSVAVGDGGCVRHAAWQKRTRGHAEALIPMVEKVLSGSGASMQDLGAIAVTLGPGTFTGVRIGLAAARGFRIARQLPIVGIGTLELLGFQAGLRWPGRPVLVALDARRDQVYAQYFRRADGAWAEAWSAPAAMSAEAAARMLTAGSIVVGSGAHLVAAHADSATIHHQGPLRPDAAALVRLAALRPAGSSTAPPPVPLYLRAPDATPAKPVFQ